MTTRTITTRRKGDPQHMLREKKKTPFPDGIPHKSPTRTFRNRSRNLHKHTGKPIRGKPQPARVSQGSFRNSEGSRKDLHLGFQWVSCWLISGFRVGFYWGVLEVKVVVWKQNIFQTCPPSNIETTDEAIVYIYIYIYIWKIANSIF